MKLWLDTHLSPALADWLSARFRIEATHVRKMKLQAAPDWDLYFAARQDGAAFMTKDSDFIRLQDRYGPPPPLIWLTIGNAKKEAVRLILDSHMEQVLSLLESGENLIEISGPANSERKSR